MNENAVDQVTSKLQQNPAVKMMKTSSYGTQKTPHTSQ